MSTTLTFHMSSAFLQELTGSSAGTGSAGPLQAYLWYNTPTADATSSPYLPSGSASNFTPLILNNQLSANVTLGSDGTYQAIVNLTDAASPTVNAGALYLLVQSGHPSVDLVTLIGDTEGNIQPNSINSDTTANYGYSQFEFSLLGKSADQADVTAISGFAQHLAVNIDYSNGSSDSRGLSGTGAAMTTALTQLEGAAAIQNPSGGPSSLSTAMVISPSNGNFGANYYPSNNWSSYLNSFAGLNDVALSGFTNGEADANGIWHNGQYYSYTMSAVQLAAGTWGAAGTYFKFSPTAASQTQGYMLISEATLQSNLYAAGQGTATLWQDSALTQPYLIPGSGSPVGTPTTTNTFNPSANDQWGNIFTPLFTGFTAGYWGANAQSSNSFDRGTTNNLGGGSINLDNSTNWSPSYAFDVNRIGTIPSYQHNDAYTQAFFNNSNFYGSAFSDNLSNGLSPTPLISVWDTAAGSNVSNIDLYAYGSNETDPYYKPPVGANYLPLASGQTDYLVPTQTSGLQLQLVGGQAGAVVDAATTLRIGIYQGGGHFEYVTVATGGNLWQTYNVTGTSGNWSITPGGPNALGTLQINNLPTPANPTAGHAYWYQVVLSDSSGDLKVYDLYATATAMPGQIQTAVTSVAADGGATFPPGTLTSSFIQLNLNPASTLPPGMLDFYYDSQQSAMPAAPVAGTLAGSSFTAFDSQNGTGILSTGAPSITIGVGSNIAFGWTGTNDGTHSGTPTNPTYSGTTLAAAGLVSNYTNKIVAGHVAMVTIYDGSTAVLQLQGTADLDGQWLTSADPQQLGNGTYTVSMQEYLSDGATIFGSGIVNAPISAVLGLNVSLTQLALQATPGGDALAFAPHGDLPNGAGNWLHFDPVAGTQLTQGAQLLLYATQADGTLVGRDGEIGAGVSIADATLARLGSMRSDGGIELLKLGQTLFLPDDQQLHFALLNGDGTVTSRPDVHITPQSNGSMLVTGAGLSFSVTVGNTIDHQDYFAAEQRSSNLPVVQLTQGETIHVEAAGSAKNANTIHFVRFDYDHASDTILGVAGVAYGNTDAFRAAVQANWDKNFAIQNGNGTFHVSQDWKVDGKQGFYAPVLVTPDGDIFVPGTANKDGRVHVQTFGENVFAFEDVRADHGADFDYNDMVVKLSML
jgi:hypothetical protein